MKILIAMVAICFPVFLSAEMPLAGGVEKSIIDSYMKGDIDMAINLLETQTKAAPENNNANAFLSKLYIEKVNELLRQNDFAGAKLYFMKAREAAPDNKDLSDLASSFDGVKKNETPLVAVITSEKKTEELKTLPRPGAVSRIDYERFLKELDARDARTRAFFESGENKIRRERKLLFFIAFIFFLVSALTTGIILTVSHRKHRRILEQAGTALAGRIEQLAKTGHPALEDKKLKNINIIDAEFTEEKEYETGSRLLEEYVSDGDPRIRAKACLVMSKYDVKKAQELIMQMTRNKDLKALELIAENITNTPPDFAQGALFDILGLDDDSVSASVYQGMKKLLSSRDLDIKVKEKIKIELKKAAASGWVI